MFSRDGRYEMDVKRRIAGSNRTNGILAVLMRRRNVSTAAQYSVDTDAVILQRNVVITDEE